jgi:hypothetical protein
MCGVNRALTIVRKTVTTSFPNRAATRWCYPKAKNEGSAIMFSIFRVVVLIACAYAGSAVAERQSGYSPDPAPAFQP